MSEAASKGRIGEDGKIPFEDSRLLRSRGRGIVAKLDALERIAKKKST